jgi:hypothetical protein
MSRLVEEFESLHAVYDGLYAWLGGQFDPVSGGFFYQRSSVAEPERFRPDIESTAQAVNVLDRASLLPSLSDGHRRAILEFILRHQEPDGYFRAEGGGQNNPERMLGRYLGYCIKVIEQLDGEPRYPLPQSFASDPTHEVLRPERLVAWMDALPWDNPWGAIDQVSPRVQILETLPGRDAADAINLILDELERRQDPDDGLWGGGDPYVHMSGGFKAIMAFGDRRPFPRPQAVYRSLRDCVLNHRADRMTFISNALNLYHAVAPGLREPAPMDEREAMFRLLLGDLWTLHRDDGGFSIESRGSWAAPNDGIVLGRGNVEGDMNSAGLSSQVWINLHRLVDVPVRPPRGAQRFFQTVKPVTSAPKIKAKC